MKMVGHNNVTENQVPLFNHDVEPFVYLVIEIGDREKVDPAVAGEGAEVGGVDGAPRGFDGHESNLGGFLLLYSAQSASRAIIYVLQQMTEKNYFFFLDFGWGFPFTEAL